MPASKASGARSRARAKTAPTGTTRAPYHHGDLPATLLAAAETVLAREGLGGLTLRSIAREAGVSHTAPRHHFGDTRGLISDLAAVGYRRLAASMKEAVAAAPSLSDRRNAVGQAYVRFAHANPRLFGLMFRNEMLDVDRESLAAAFGSAMRQMMSSIDGKPVGVDARTHASTIALPDVLRATAAWAYVHGLAVLLIDDRLSGLARRSNTFADPFSLVSAVLDRVRLDINVRSQAPREPTRKASKKKSVSRS